MERNFTLQTIYQLISTIIPIFTIPFITRNLGADRIGYYSYLASICSYFVLVANLGSYSYGVREIAYFQNDRKKYSEIFSGIQLLRFYLSCVVLFFYFLYSLIFDEDKLILAILSLNIFNVIFDISWFYNGIEDFRPIVSRALVLKLLYAASLFIFVRSENNFYAYAIVQVGFTLLISLSYWAGLRNVVDFTFKVKPFKHLKGTFSLFLPALAIQMYTVLDKTMIGMFSTENYNENAYYEFAQNIVRSCLILCTSLTKVSAPKISFYIASNNTNGMKNQLYNSYSFVWFTGLPICVSLFAIAPLFVPIYFGAGYDKVSVLIRVLLPLILIVGMSSVSGNQYFVPKDFIKVQTISLVSGSLINVILNAFFIPRYFAAGASIASVIAELSVTVCQFIFIARYKEISVWKVIFSSWRYLLASIILAIYYYILISTFSFLDIFSVIILVLFGIVVYVVSLVILRDPGVLYYIRIKKGC